MLYEASLPPSFRIRPGSKRHDRLRRGSRGGCAGPIRSAYPTIVTLRLELHFEGSEARVPADSSACHAPTGRAAFFEFPCPYADCDGQFNLSDAVGAALSSGEEIGGGAAWACWSAWVFGPRTKPAGSRASLHLHYTITPEYPVRRPYLLRRACRRSCHSVLAHTREVHGGSSLPSKLHQLADQVRPVHGSCG